MSKLKLNAFVTKALLDRDFEKDILNGHRRDRLNDFDLPGDEVKAIMSIKADNLDQLIHKIGDYIYASGA